MYCGDETGSYIGDVGSHVCRFGYGAEDNPKFVMPSYVCNKTHMAPSCLSERVALQDLECIMRTPECMASASLSSLSPSSDPQSANSNDNLHQLPMTDPNSFLRQGDMVENWDNLQVAWHTSMDALHAKDTLKHTQGGSPYSTTIKSTAGAGEGKCAHPILAVTPGFTHLDGFGPSFCAAQQRQQQIQYTEMLMESLDASSIFLAPSPMLSAFSFGRQTVLVVDIGAGGCRVTPVVEGLILGQSQRRNGRGGDWLGHILWKALLEEKVVPVPRYQLRKKVANTVQPKRPLFHKWAMQDLMYGVLTDPDMKVSVSEYDADKIRVPFLDPLPPPSPPSSPEPGSPTTPTEKPAEITAYQLPDGTSIDLSSPLAKNISRIPDLLFSDRIPFQSASGNSESTEDPSFNLATLSNAPLHKLIRESLLAIGDVDARKELANCICLTGGASVIPNLDARLSAELTNLFPQFVKPRVIASRQSIERSCASWIGGSILTSLGSFQQLWLSRTEYDEYGAALSIQRFP